jgi:hypothetical protein
MFKVTLSTKAFRGAMALTAILGAGVAVMGAQTLAKTSVPTEMNFQAPVISTSGDALFSSSATDNAAPVTEASIAPMTPNFAEMMQYGGRPRGGRPRYRGANTNPDGSNKYMGFGGAGFTQPIGNTYKYLTPSYGIQVGFGRQWSKNFALPIQFDYDHFGFTRQNLGNESYIYTGDSNPSDNGIDANSHIWSFSLDPTYTFVQGDKVGAYVVAGVGFYHKVGNLTAPQNEVYYDPYYGPEEFEVQGNFATFTSNAPGFNGGFGLTYKFSHFSNERFYAEVRYVYIDNSQRSGATVANVATYTGNNGYPANSNRTSYIPVKFGLRF